LVERKACLLANHGMIALGRDLEDALAVCQEVENLCEQVQQVLNCLRNYITQHEN
jgi:L-fuculose-phosphate aldolase